MEGTTRKVDDPGQSVDPQSLYLNLMKQVLTRTIVPEHYHSIRGSHGPTKAISKVILGIAGRLLDSHNLEIVRRYTPDLHLREIGKDWPEEADTMIGIRRLDNIHRCVADVL